MNKTQSFEDYLKDIHAKNYMGTDDEMPDRFEAWLMDMQVDNLIDYADAYGKRQYDLGLNNAIEVIRNIEDAKGPVDNYTAHEDALIMAINEVEKLK